MPSPLCLTSVQLTDKRFLACSLAFSAGVMLYVSFVEIFVKAVEEFTQQQLSWAYLAATLCLFAGCAITVLLDMLVHLLVGQGSGHHGHGHSHGAINPPYGVSSPSQSPKAKQDTPSAEAEMTAITVSEDGSEKTGEEKLAESDSAEADIGFVNEDKSQMHKTGLLVALAIGIHNFPEGLITFVGALSSPSVGIALCIAITSTIYRKACALPYQYFMPQTIGEKHFVMRLHLALQNPSVL